MLVSSKRVQQHAGIRSILTIGWWAFDLFIAPNGEAIATIATAPPGNYVSSIDERVSSK